MKNEDIYLIQIMRNHLSGVKTEPISHVDWAYIFSLSQSHEVSGIVYCQCKDYIPTEFLALFERKYGTALYYYANRKKALQYIMNELQEVPFFFVKGIEVAKYYPMPPLRTMGDCDIVVNPEDFQNTINELCSLGFNGTSVTDVHEWSCDYLGLHFELHDVLVRDGEYANTIQVTFFNNYSLYVHKGVLDDNFHYLFLLMHLRKHFINNGVGIRQFMDIAVEIQRGPELDWVWIEEKLLYLNLSVFAHACYSIIEKWFGIVAPVVFDRLDECAIREITEKVICNGVFGFADNNNRDNKASNALLLKDGNEYTNRFLYFFSNLFPGYTYMNGYPGCGFLTGRKLLLPIAWGRRFIHIIVNHRNRSRIDTLKSTFISHEDLNSRELLLKQMGIIE